MLNLQRKAHIALQEQREGRPSHSNLTKPKRDVSPSEDDDELSKLGGKTRYHKDADLTKSPSTPSDSSNSLSMHAAGTRSPNTQNPVVPFPLQHAELQHDVREYLQTFQPVGVGLGASLHSIQDAEMSNAGSEQTPIYGNASARALYAARGPTHSSTILNPDMSYMRSDSYSQQTPGMSSMVDSLPPSRQNSLETPHGYAPSGIHQHQQHEHAQQTYLPQYFPVFDYGSSNIQGDNVYSSLAMHAEQSQPGSSSGGMSGGQVANYDFATQSPFTLQNGHGQPQGPSNMHASWMDLVQEYSM
jgi:hypothetical protein